MSADGGGIDPRDAARVTAGVGDLAAHALLAGGAMLAGLLRLASYSGPPRPWRVMALDTTMQVGTGIGVGEIALGVGAGPHVAIGLTIMTGVVGWEVVKQIAAKRAAREK